MNGSSCLTGRQAAFAGCKVFIFRMACDVVLPGHDDVGWEPGKACVGGRDGMVDVRCTWSGQVADGRPFPDSPAGNS